MNNNKGKKKQIWALTSGKGGVGKSFLSSSLAISMAKKGKSVLLIDLDSHGGNLHTCLGLEPSEKNLRHFFSGQMTLKEIIRPTAVSNLSFIQGAWGSWQLFHFSNFHLNMLFQSLQNLKADLVILDLSLAHHEIYFHALNKADCKLVVTTPEPMSVERTYRCIESYLIHCLSSSLTPLEKDRFMHSLYTYRSKNHGKLFSFYEFIQSQNDVLKKGFQCFQETKLYLIVNSCRVKSHFKLGKSIESVCLKYYNIDVCSAGSVEFDNMVWQSLEKMKSPINEQTFFTPMSQLLAICKKLSLQPIPFYQEVLNSYADEKKGIQPKQLL